MANKSEWDKHWQEVFGPGLKAWRLTPGGSITCGDPRDHLTAKEDKGPESIEINEAGGKQSHIEGRITEVPPIALIEVGKVMGLGSHRYPRESDNSPNWYRIDCYSNLDHSLLHLANFLVDRNNSNRNKDRMREELSHFAARGMMALEQFIRENY